MLRKQGFLKCCFFLTNYLEYIEYFHIFAQKWFQNVRIILLGGR